VYMKPSKDLIMCSILNRPHPLHKNLELVAALVSSNP
jgi:hypothetical protein